ncbi:hypothetical protein ACOME3_001649 [Neoechinorhynchus agilis]
MYFVVCLLVALTIQPSVSRRYASGSWVFGRSPHAGDDSSSSDDFYHQKVPSRTWDREKRFVFQRKWQDTVSSEDLLDRREFKRPKYGHFWSKSIKLPMNTAPKMFKRRAFPYVVPLVVKRRTQTYDRPRWTNDNSFDRSDILKSVYGTQLQRRRKQICRDVNNYCSSMRMKCHKKDVAKMCQRTCGQC